MECVKEDKIILINLHVFFYIIFIIIIMYMLYILIFIHI